MKSFLTALLFCLATSPLMFAQAVTQFITPDPNIQLSIKTSARLIPQVGGGTTHGIDLTWPASATASVTGYNVKRGTTTGGPYTKIGSTTGALAFSDVSAPLQTEGATFFYVVTATGPGGESANSPEANATIPFSVPAAPGKPTALSH